MFQTLWKFIAGLSLLISTDCLIRDKRQVQYCITPDNYRGYCLTLTNCQQVVLQYSQNGGTNFARQYLYGLKKACNNIVLEGDPVICCTQENLVLSTTGAKKVKPVSILNDSFYAMTRAEFKFNNSEASNTLQYCVTPDNYQGYCATLTNCQYLKLLYLQYGGSNQFRQYFFGSKNACNNVVVGGDPVVCCNQNNGVSQTERTPPTTATSKKPVTSTSSVPSQTESTISQKNYLCQGPDGLPGSCISLKNCPLLIAKLEQNPTDLQYAQFLRDSNAVCGVPAPIICCPRSEKPSVPSTTDQSENLIITDRFPTPEEGCGVVADQLFKKVVGGQPAKPGDWPWIALLGYVESNGESSFKCGGALITSRHILTAAHCLRRNLKFVRLGENDLSKESETQYMDIQIDKTFIHSKYDRKDGHSDIAVLRLVENAPYTNFIRFACIPYGTSLRTKSYVDLNPFVAGWGKTQEDGKSAEVLQEIQVPVHHNEECVKRYSAEGRYVSTKQFDDSVLCAGVLAGGIDTCQGDSGGPLVQPEFYGTDKKKLHYYVIGVVSYGIGCARPNIPGVYTNVPKFVDWIQQQIKDTT